MNYLNRLDRIAATLKRKGSESNYDLSEFTKDDLELMIQMTSEEELIKFYENPEETKQDIKGRMAVAGAKTYSELRIIEDIKKRPEWYLKQLETISGGKQ